jgi:uncharacterized protein (TIGR03437 family)
MTSFFRKLAQRQIGILLGLLLSSSAYAQGPSLSLASGSAPIGGSVSLNLSLNAGASSPAALQWTLSYVPSGISSLSMVAGPALTAAGKTLNCNSSSGSVICLATGMNANTITSGVVAVVTATVAATSSSLDSISIGNVLGSLPDGTSLSVSGTGGTISVTQPNPLPTISSLSPGSATAGTAAFTLTVNGTGFLNGSIVKWNGTARTTTFVSATQLRAAITAADIAAAGTGQVTVFNPTPGGGTSGNAAFVVTAPNPVPTISSLSPGSATAGTAAFTLTVNGTGFLNGSVVNWNGTNRATTFVSATQLQAAITAADIATAGTGQVTVFNPAPGGGTSGASAFTIIAANPIPTISSLLPVSATAGTAAFTLTVNGAGFLNGSVVKWNGTNRTTTFVSATQLQVAITALDILTALIAQVTVFNPAPGGGTSGNAAFTINASNPVPAITSLLPGNATAGTAAFTLTVSGTGFLNGSIVKWNGANRTTTFVSATQLQAAITAADIAAAGTAQVTVFNAAPGGGTSGNAAFAINASNPVPTITSLLPGNATAGTAAFTMTVNGTGFMNGSVVKWNGASRTTTFVRATQLQAAITAADIATAGTGQVTVFNAAPGGGTSGNAAFAINASNPVPTISSLAPASAAAGTAAFTLTVNGTGFLNSSIVKWNGTARTTTFVSATQLQAAITAADIATAGTGQVTVFNPTPGGGTSGNAAFTVNAANLTSASFVQETAVINGASTTSAISFPAVSSSGNLIIVSVTQDNQSANVTAIADNKGNVYSRATSGLNWGASGKEARSELWYAKNITGGGTPIKATVTFSISPRQFVQLYISEYSGLDPVAPLDQTSTHTAAGNFNGNFSSGSKITTSGNELVFGHCEMWNGYVGAGPGLTTHSNFNGNIEESKNVSSAASYDASCSESGSGPLAMMATFKIAASKPSYVLSSLSKQSIPVADRAGRMKSDGAGTNSADVLRALSCSPRTVSAGDRVICELHVAASPDSLHLRLESSSDLVKIPVAVSTRPNQPRLTFQAVVDAIAKKQGVTLTATLDGASVQDTILVTASSTPVLTVPDKQFAKFGIPLRFRVHGVDASELPVQLSADVPAGAVFNPLNGQFEWTPDISQAGKYQITITATNVAGQSSRAQVQVEVDSGRPVVVGSSALACSPGAIGTLNGKWLVESEGRFSDASGSVLELGGTTLRINDQPVWLLAASRTRVNFLCPAVEPGELLSMTVETAAGISEPVKAVMRAASPEIFSLDGTGENQGVVSFADMNTMVSDRNYRVSAYPAQPGDEILIWGTGLGLPGEGRGESVVVTLGGMAAEVLAVRPVPDHAGVYTIQAFVPATTVFGDAVPVKVQILMQDGKRFTSNSVTVVIEPVNQ